MIVGHRIPKNTEIRPADETDFDQTDLRYMGAWCSYNDFLEFTVYTILFKDTVSVTSRKFDHSR
jgi:hypothetical protein